MVAFGYYSYSAGFQSDSPPRIRPVFSSCFHMGHWKCMQSVKKNHEMEFMCPQCKRLSNILINISTQHTHPASSLQLLHQNTLLHTLSQCQE